MRPHSHLQSLLAHLSTRFDLKQEVFPIGNHAFPLYTISNIDQLLDEVAEQADDHEDIQDDRVPYWAELWPSALGMAEYLMEHKEFIQGKEVLEVGCGLGFPGIVAHHLGGQVHMTDYLPDALDLVQLNWQLNFGQKANASLLDWRSATPEFEADVVLASDVAYEKRAFEPLLDAFRVLVRPGGKLILSEPSRAWSQEFVRQLGTLGQIVDQQIFTPTYKGNTYRVMVYVIVFSTIAKGLNPSQ